MNGRQIEANNLREEIPCYVHAKNERNKRFLKSILITINGSKVSLKICTLFNINGPPPLVAILAAATLGAQVIKIDKTMKINTFAFFMF